LVNNIVKYAESKNVTISIHADRHAMHIVVIDDGKGFDVNKKRKGIGISNMIHRVESFNGEIAIESSPGKDAKHRLNTVLIKCKPQESELSYILKIVIVN